MNDILDSPEIEILSTIIEEAIRSTEAGIKRFVEPAKGTLNRAKSKQHQIVFGRRGSGKSSLLRKAVTDLKKDRRPIAYIDLETYKGHSFPDVLISVLIESLTKFEIVLNELALSDDKKLSFVEMICQKIFRNKQNRSGMDKKKAKEISVSLDGQIKKLKELLHSADEVETEKTVKLDKEKFKENELKAGTAHEGLTLEGKSAGSEKETASEEVKEAFHRKKFDFLLRNIKEYQSLFHQISELSSGDSYIFLDDLYHIRRNDQANVIDYFHRIAKGNNLWLKIGTIRHRSQWYIHSDPPLGVKIGDDADEIDLDLTLESYSQTKQFLVKILNGFLIESGKISIDQILSGGAVDRLVLASGGVARDFLGVFRKSIDVARERGKNHRGEKIGAEDVNVAVGKYESTKKEEFKRDTLEDQVKLESEWQQIRNFCINQAKANLFLLDIDEKTENIKHIHELVDLRLIHKVKSRVTVSACPGKIYEAYMLDVSQYTGARKIRGFKMIEFWLQSSIEELRRKSMIYDPKINN